MFFLASIPEYGFLRRTSVIAALFAVIIALLSLVFFFGAVVKGAQNRFNLYVQRFISAFAREGEPLALFLDDLQWADSHSLDLISTLMSGVGNAGLLIIAAYRNNEVPGHHPLDKLLTSLRESGATLHEISLSPLKVNHVTSLLAETLHLL